MNIGDYVRTKKGIAKIIDKNDDVRMWYPNAFVTDIRLKINGYSEYIYKEDIIKSSPNIIYLIEVGDYVNGYKVVEIESFDDNKLVKLDFNVENDYLHWCECTETANIKSILTKEQFASMEYRLDGE